MKLMNSDERKNMRSETLIGIRAKKTSNILMNLIARSKRLISFACFWTSSVGKTLVQN